MRKMLGPMFGNVVVSMVRLKVAGATPQFKDLVRKVTLTGAGITRAFDVPDVFGGEGDDDYKAIVIILTNLKKEQGNAYKESYKINAQFR